MKPRASLRRFFPLSAIVLAGAFASHSAMAQTYTWTPTAAGTYNWNNASAQNNWTSGFPNAIGDIANLNINILGNQIINLNQAITVGTINLGDTTGATYHTTTIAPAGGSLIMDVASGSATLSKATIGNNVTDTISASIQLNDNLIVNNTATSTSGLLVLSGNITESGSQSLTKTGVGIVRLSGANSYTGLTTISQGTLQLFSNTGSLNAASGLTFNGGGGTFNMDNSGAGASRSQSLGALTFSAGDGTVLQTRTATQNQLLTFSSLAARATGATGSIFSGGTLSASNGLALTGQSAGFIDRGLFYGTSATQFDHYAWYDGTGFVRAMVYGTDSGAVTSGTTASLASATHQQITGAITAQNTATFSTLKISGAQNLTLAAAQTVTVDGILKTGNNSSIITGGTGIQASNNSELVIRTDRSSDSLSINNSILANGTNALTKTGAGTLTLGTTNYHTGGTYLNAGTLTLSNAAALGAGTFTINGGTVSVSSLTLSGAIPIVMNGNWSARTSNSGATFNTGTGGITLNAPITINVTNSQLNLGGAITSPGSAYNALDISFTRSDSQNAGVTFTSGILLRGNQVANTSTIPSITYSSPITDGGNNYGLTFSSPTTYTLNGLNSFTGAMVINSGSTVVLNAGGTIKSTAVTINTGGTLSLGVQNLGATTAKIDTTSTITNNGVLKIGDNVAYLQGTDFPSGISGTGSVVISGTRATGVTLSGTNTYLGGTSVIYTGGGGPVVLNINSANAIGSGTLTLSQSGSNSATINNTSGGAITLATNNAQAWNGPITFTGTNALNLGTGTVTLANNPTMNVSANTLTVGGTVNGTGNTLSKAGAGILELNGATTLGSLNVGQNNSGGTLTIGTGATISVGTSASNSLYVGSNTGGSNPVGNGTFNALDLTAKVGIFGVGYSAAPTSASGTSTGVLTLSGDATIQADTVYVGVGQSSGAGGNFKTNGSFSLAADATLDLSGTTGAGANLYVGWSFGGGNASQQIGSMDLSAGAADMTLSQLSIARGSNSVSGTGTLTLSGSHTNHLVVNGTGNVVTIGATSGTASTGTATLRNLDATSAITTTAGSTAIVLGANNNGTGNLTLSSSTLTITTTGSAIARVAGTGNLTLDNTTLIAGASNAVSGKWITNLNTATLTNTVTFDSGVHTISTDQVFTGAGSLTKKGAGTLGLSGANTFAGQLSVQAGTLAIATINDASTNGVLGNSANAVSLGNTGNVTGTLQYTGATASSTKRFTMATGGTGAFQIDNSGTNLSVSGVIDGGGNLTKTGAGTLTLTAGTTHSYTGTTYVTEGTLVVDGNISTSSLTTIGNGVDAATLEGSGTVGDLTISANAFHNPGNSPGIVNTGDYTMAGTLTIEFDGLTPGVGGHDQVNVTGTVNLSGSLVVDFAGGTYANGNMIFILLNDSNDAINGTFSNYANGDVVFSDGGLDWQISYFANSGGTPTFTGGNDIALMAVTVIPEPAAAILGSLGMVLLLRRRRVA